MTTTEYTTGTDPDVHDRSNAERWPDVEVRGYVEPELEILTRARGGDGRTVYGILVPYGKRQRIHEGLEEMFRRGAAAHQVNRPRLMKFAREHVKLGGTLIGRATELREDAAGLVGYLRASATPAGDEALTLVEDGVLEELSVGFRAVRDKRHADGLVERVRVDVLETALVLQGAYGRGARVMGLRSTDGENGDQEPDEGQDGAGAGELTEHERGAAGGGMTLEHARALAAGARIQPATAADLRRMIR